MNQAQTSGGPDKLKRIGKGILIFLLVLAVIDAGATLILGKKVAEKIADLRAKGEPVLTSDLGKPKVPDNENAAIIYEQAFPILEDKSARSDMDAVKDFRLGGNVEAALVRFKPVLPIVEKAVERPKCQFPVKWKDGFGALIPYVSRMWQIGRILDKSALTEAGKGRTDAALHMVELNIKVSQSLQDDPAVIGQMVRVDILNSAAISLNRVATMGNIDESQARRITDMLAGIDPYPGFYKSIEGSRTLGIFFFDNLRNGTFGLRAMNDLQQYGWKPEQYRTTADFLIRSWAFKPFVYSTECAYLDVMDKEIKLSKLTSLQLRKQGNSNIDAIPIAPRYTVHILEELTIPQSGQRQYMYRDDGMAYVNGSRVLLGLIVYKDRFGAYPKSLDDLKKKLGWEVPKDPFTGNDFIYKRQGNGFLFYSIGKDFSDDHAQTEATEHEVSDKIHYWDGTPYITPGGRFAADIIWQMSH